MQLTLCSFGHFHYMTNGGCEGGVLGGEHGSGEGEGGGGAGGGGAGGGGAGGSIRGGGEAASSSSFAPQGFPWWAGGSAGVGA